MFILIPWYCLTTYRWSLHHLTCCLPKPTSSLLNNCTFCIPSYNLLKFWPYKCCLITMSYGKQYLIYNMFSQIQKWRTMKVLSGWNTYAQSFGLLRSPTTTSFQSLRRLRARRASVGWFIVVATIHLLCNATSSDARLLPEAPLVVMSYTKTLASKTR